MILGRRQRLSLALLTPVIAFALLQAFPQLIFAHNLAVSGINLYSTEPLPAQASDVLRMAAELVSHSELSDPGRVANVFVPARPWIARIFNPTSDGFAFHVAITGNIFVTQGDLTTNSARNESATHNHRVLSAVIAHEITHDLISARFGIAKGRAIPAWVSEGYCDYVAREGSFPEAEGMALMRSGGSDNSMSFQYFLYRHVVAYLIDERHMALLEIVRKSESSENFFRDTLRDLRERENRGS